ncbi:MAG: hypothetical protein ACRC33_05500, partial [Gemmataceae bacterium]
YLTGAAFAAVGLTVLLIGLLAPLPALALRIMLPLFGLLFAGAGVAVIVLAARGVRISTGAGGSADALYLLTNRRAIVWVNKATVRAFTGPMVMNMTRKVEPEHEDEDFGSLLFTHGHDAANLAGPGFCDVEKVSEVEELVRGYLIDRVLEKSAAAAAPTPAVEPNPFAKAGPKQKGPGKRVEVWQAAALAMEADKPLTPEMIAAARGHTDGVLDGSKLSDAEAGTVRDELQPGEAAVWAGKPDPAATAMLAWLVGGAVAVFSVVVMIILTGMYFVFAKQAGGGPFYLGMGLFGLLSAAGVIGGLCYPAYEKWRSARTFYALTSRRALVWAADWRGTPALEAFGPRDLSNLHVVTNNVVFRTETTVYTSKKSGTHAATRRYGFIAVEDAPALERLVRETLVEPFLEKAYE